MNQWAKVDREISRQWLEEAADEEISKARVLLAFVYLERDLPGLAEGALAPAVEAGDAEANYLMGLIHWNRQDGQDGQEQAVACFRRAAEQGDVRAMYALGACFESRSGVPTSYREARRWIHQAHSLGYGKASAWLTSRSEHEG